MAQSSHGANEEGDRSRLYNEERSDNSDERPPKRPAASETLDRISELPEAIILHILSLLPMHEVVKTSSLSKKWQHLWTSVPNLVFTNNKSSDRVYDFVRFVDQTLIQCRHSKIHRFSLNLKCTSPFAAFASQIDQCIRFATRCVAEELFINLSTKLIPEWPLGTYTLPEQTYSCSSITKLKLSYCNFVPKGLIIWKSLRKLWLKTSDVSDDAIQNILSGSPFLRFLGLDYCGGFKRLDINSTSLKRLFINGYWSTSSEQISHLEILAPNLRSLVITGSLRLKTFRLVNMLSLVDAYLNFHCTSSGQDTKADRNRFKELLQSLNHVKELTLGCMCLWWFGASIADSYDLEKYWTSTESIIFPCLQRHLKIVKCVGFNGWALERVLPFLEFLLKNARVLQKMVISAQNVGGGKHSCCASNELLKVAQKLLNCPRSSRKAVVIFTE